MSTALEDSVVRQILARFGLHPPVNDERFLAHAEIDRGIRVTIEGRIDPELDQKVVVLHSARASVSHTCPLTMFEGLRMVDALREAHVVPDDDAFRGMLVHLLGRSAKLYARSGIDSFTFDPVYLTRRGYRIGAARMLRTQKVRVKKRLQPDAHDRKALFEYRPTAEPVQHDRNLA
ncbi:MAG: hypothetical protein ACXWNK_06755 [Vulcanimicrobiaceae bacterium]